MNAIVLNTISGAVSEYSNFDFQSITPTHAGAATGLFELVGDTDLDFPIVASVTTGKKLWASSLKKSLELMYFSIKGSGASTARIVGATTSSSYTFPVRPCGQSRCRPGRGIRENYLAFGYSNTDGEHFQLDRIEVLVAESKNRRV